MKHHSDGKVYSERGFREYVVFDSKVTSVRVHQSSSAEADKVWIHTKPHPHMLEVYGEDWTYPAELTVEEAIKVRDALSEFIEDYS
jgi:hypothetical protein